MIFHFNNDFVVTPLSVGFDAMNMRNLMKKNLHLLVIIACCATSTVAHGQFSIPVTTTIKTPHGNVPYTYYVPSAMPNLYKNPDISRRYEFKVVFLENDSSFIAKGKITSDEEGLNFLELKLKGAKGEVYPSETKSIARKGLDGWITGIPADTCWLFKTATGRINSYSFLAEPETTLIIAIQKGVKGEILPLTKENLLPMVEDDPKATRFAEENDLFRAIKRYNTRNIKND